MTNIRYLKTDDELTMTFDGHANSARKGQDIVCSAASILFYTLAESIRAQKKESFLREPEIKIKSGGASVTCAPAKEYYDAISNVYEVVATGAKLLAFNEPEYILFEEVDSPTSRAD